MNKVWRIKTWRCYQRDVNLHSNKKRNFRFETTHKLNVRNIHYQLFLKIDMNFMLNILTTIKYNDEINSNQLTNYNMSNIRHVFKVIRSTNFSNDMSKIQFHSKQTTIFVKSNFNFNSTPFVVTKTTIFVKSNFNIKSSLFVVITNSHLKSISVVFTTKIKSFQMFTLNIMNMTNINYQTSNENQIQFVKNLMKIVVAITNKVVIIFEQYKCVVFDKSLSHAFEEFFVLLWHDDIISKNNRVNFSMWSTILFDVFIELIINANVNVENKINYYERTFVKSNDLL